MLYLNNNLLYHCSPLLMLSLANPLLHLTIDFINEPLYYNAHFISLTLGFIDPIYRCSFNAALSI